MLITTIKLNYCKSSKNFVFNMNYLKKVVEYLIRNTYFAQIIGISLGSDPMPFFVNLFLFYYEQQYINLKENNKSAIDICYTFGFTGHVITINNENLEKYVHYRN